MGRMFQCTLSRPDVCKYYIESLHRCGNDEGNSLEVCRNAKEIIPADEIQPDFIDREILRMMRKRAAHETSFMYDPTTKDEIQEEGKRIMKLFEYVLNQEKNKKTEVVDMNNNHEFPHDIAKALEALKFEKKELRYYGKAQNYRIKDAIIEFGIDGDSLLCKDVTSMKTIFIVDSTIGLGYFLVLLQAFGIYHKRFVYERVDSILEQFIYDQEDQ